MMSMMDGISGWHCWDCCLTASEIKAIADGMDPRLVHPEKHQGCCNPESALSDEGRALMARCSE